MEKAKSITFDGEVKTTDLTIPQNFNWEAVNKAPSGINLAPAYLEFNNVGESIRAVYLGTSYIEKNEKDEIKKIPVVLLATEKGVLMNGGVALYDTITKFCRLGEAIEVTYTGQRKTGSGGYLKTYTVTPLII